jgi:hypothetical protein
MKLYVVIGADGFVFDIETTLATTRERVRRAVGALEGCTVAEYRVPQDLQNVRALFFHTFGRRVPVEATVVRAWWVTKRGAMRPLPIGDYEGIHDRLQRRVLGAKAAPKRLVESYFDSRLERGDEVLPIDSSYGDSDRDTDPSAGAEGETLNADGERTSLDLLDHSQNARDSGADSRVFSS